MTDVEPLDEPEREELRALVDQTPKVAAPEDVDVPEWAEQLEIGDRLGFWVGRPERRFVQPIVGFSTTDEGDGMPVVRTPEGLDADSKHLAIPEDRHLSPEEVDDAE